MHEHEEMLRIKKAAELIIDKMTGQGRMWSEHHMEYQNLVNRFYALTEGKFSPEQYDAARVNPEYFKRLLGLK